MRNQITTFFNHPFSIFDDVFNSETPFYKINQRVNYNIEKISEDTKRLSLNVAGMSKNDIEITVKDNILSIKGEAKEDKNDNYIYKSFHSKFYNSFQISENAEVMNAEIKDGILYIDIKDHQKIEEEPKKILIK